MSYVEHGSRIFLAGTFNAGIKPGKHVVTRRSEGRLKLYDSCSDIRAWSPNAQENCHHFRKIMENRIPSGRILPYEVLFESLITLGQTELNAMRRQLEKFKSLKLTPEQENQLRDFDYSSPVSSDGSKTRVIKEARLVEDQTGIPKRPGTPTQSYCSLSSNFQDTDEIENDSTTDNSDRSQEAAFLSSENYEDTHSDGGRHMGCCGNYQRENENQEIIIKKDSEIIALSHELAARNAELDELRDKVRILESLRINIKEQLLVEPSEKMRQESEEWKKKFYDSKRLVEQLRMDNFQECLHLRERAWELETLRREKLSLAVRLDELKNVEIERDDLLKINREQATSLSDQESEINKLLAFIEQNFEKHEEQEIKWKSQLYELRSELEAKNSAISQFERHEVTVRTSISPTTGSFNKFRTSEIRELRIALRDDLEAVDEELLRRRSARIAERDFKQGVNHCEKDVMECSIEKLTMQVSSSRVESEEFVEAKAVAELTRSTEKMQRLILELEAYIEERAALNSQIEEFQRKLENEERLRESREIEIEEKFTRIENLMRILREEKEEFRKRFEHLKNLRKKEIHREEDRDEMDKEIETALAMCMKRSIEINSKLSLGLRGAGDEMTKIRDDLEKRDAEIARLREQVKFHISRGQGDEANNEHLKDALKLKSEKKRLLDELKVQGESLKTARDQLQSREFELKGLKQQRKELSAQHQRELQRTSKTIEELKRRNERVSKENECLNKTVLMFNDLVVESDSMKNKLESLQEENSKVIDENKEMMKRCDKYENRLMDFANKELQMKEAMDRAEFDFEQETKRSKAEIASLRSKNEKLIKETESMKLKIEKMTEEVRDAQENSRDRDAMENVWAEILKVNDERQKLDDKVRRLGYSLESQQRTNGKLEEQLKWQINQNQILEDTIRYVKENIKSISEEDEIRREGFAKQVLMTLPDKISMHFNQLRKQLNNSGLVVSPWLIEMKEMRTRLLENDSTTEKLRNELDSWENKCKQQENNISILEEANKDLKVKLLERCGASESSLEAKLQSHAENKIKRQEMEILRLAENVELKNSKLKALGEKIETLSSERNEIQRELDTERNLRQIQLSELQQKRTAEKKSFRDMHNDSIKKLLVQQEESMQSGNKLLDLEVWLRNLTEEELVELHKRTSTLIPYEKLGGAFETLRSLNDKQNQLLQQDGKLYVERRYPYKYERRKFNESKPVNTSLDDNVFNAKRKEFYRMCAKMNDTSH